MAGSGRPLHAIIPLALLETMRDLDVPASEDPTGLHPELVTPRLGTSRTVAAQIERYEALARRNRGVDPAEAAALMRLAGRRNDAGLVFADAGRRAAAHAAARVPLAVRLLWRAAPPGTRRRLGFTLARRVVERTFAIALTRDGAQVAAAAEGLPSVHATEDGSACGFYGSAMAALLRRFTNFDGAVQHVSCAARGAPGCRWDTAAS
jgi:hypothetical protein